MITLKASVLINASPEKVFQFFNNLRENYPTMHPDHVECTCDEGSLKEDAVIHVKEIINGRERKYRLHLMTVKQDIIEYDFPFGAGGAFIITGKDGKTSLTEEIRIGFKTRLLYLIDKLIMKLFNKQLQGINNHLEDELITIKKTIEGTNITRWD